MIYILILLAAYGQPLPLRYYDTSKEAECRSDASRANAAHRNMGAVCISVDRNTYAAPSR